MTRGSAIEQLLTSGSAAAPHKSAVNRRTSRAPRLDQLSEHALCLDE